MKRAMFALIGILLAVPATVVAQEVTFTEEFDVDDCRFSDRGRNPYFSLEPGDQLVLEGEEDGEVVLVKQTVLRNHKWVTFRTPEGETLQVRTRVVEEREWKDGELIEVSRNFYARCTETDDIYYFGEEVDIYDGGVIASHDGAWRAGFDGAQPGLIMPQTFLLGARYYQEIAPPVALDRAEHVRMHFEMNVRAGVFDDCVEIVETTPLEPGHESRKIYCAEIGLVADGVAELIDFRAQNPGTGPRSRRSGR